MHIKSTTKTQFLKILKLSDIIVFVNIIFLNYDGKKYSQFFGTQQCGLFFNTD